MQCDVSECFLSIGWDTEILLDNIYKKQILLPFLLDTHQKNGSNTKRGCYEAHLDNRRRVRCHSNPCRRYTRTCRCEYHIDTWHAYHSSSVPLGTGLNTWMKSVAHSFPCANLQVI